MRRVQIPLTSLLPFASSVALLATVLALPVGAAHAQYTPVIDIHAGNPGDLIPFDGNNNTLGYSFTVASGASITINALGFLDYQSNGLDIAHQVGIWNSTGTTLLASATIPAGTSATAGTSTTASASGQGSYRFVSIGNIVLSSGTYLIGGFYQAAYDTDHGLGSTSAALDFSNNPKVSYGTPQVSNVNTGFAAPTISENIPSGTLGPAFAMASSSTPEPGSAFLAVLGLMGMAVLAGRRRQHISRNPQSEQKAL